MTDQESTACVITCAGLGSRMGKGIKKEYRKLDTLSVLEHSIRIFSGSSLFSSIIVTIPQGGEHEARASLSIGCRDLITLCFVTGGSTRRESVLFGLRALAEKNPRIVLIHDAARPFALAELALAVREAAIMHGAAAPAVPVVDTIKTIGKNGMIESHLRRSSLVSIQTPQGFKFPEILAAHEKAEALARSNKNLEYTDDTEIWDASGGKTFIVSGSLSNKKITFREDLQ